MDLPPAFPWTARLSDAEAREFGADLVNATWVAAQQGSYDELRRVIAEWRATGAVLADPGPAGRLTAPLPSDDHGEVPAP